MASNTEKVAKHKIFVYPKNYLLRKQNFELGYTWQEIFHKSKARIQKFYDKPV